MIDTAHCYDCGRRFDAPAVDRDHEDPDRCTDCVPVPARFVAVEADEPQPESEDDARVHQAD